MVSAQVLVTAILQLAAVLVAGYGALRCIRLQRFGSDRRLTALAWFFGLFAVAVALQGLWQVTVGDPGDAGPFGVGFQPRNGPDMAPAVQDGSSFIDLHQPSSSTEPPTAPPPPPAGPGGPRPGPGRQIFDPQGAERVNILVVGHHLAMLACLVVAVIAFSRKAPKVVQGASLAIVPFATVGQFIPLVLAIEAGLTLYLAARAFIHHFERKVPGAMQSAVGFFLFFCGHLLFYVSHSAGVVRSGLGEVLGLVGIVLLVQLLPGRGERARSAK